MTESTFDKSFKVLTDVHRGWCEYCKGNEQVCMDAPRGGCSLRDCISARSETARKPLTDEQIMSAACAAADALDATRVSEMKNGGWHATTIFDGDSGLLRFGRLIEREVGTIPSAIPQKKDWGRAQVGLDGDHGYALLGADLQSGEAEFSPIEGWPTPTYKQEREAWGRALKKLEERLGSGLLRYEVIR